jgi:hypothetical protein
LRGRTWTPVLCDLTTPVQEELVGKLADALRGSEVSAQDERRSAETEKAYQAARTAITKERVKIKEEKLRGKERREAIAERIAPLQKDADDKRTTWLAALKKAVPRHELALGQRIDCTETEYRDHAFAFIDDPDSRESLEMLAAFGTDACVEEARGDAGNRKIQATPFCFIRGSGHQNFLETIRKLLAKVSPEGLTQALFVPWVYRDAGLSMRWDPAEDKRYALMDVKPADEGALTVWMANLLAYRGLAFFPCAPTRRGLGTTGWALLKGNDEERAVFTWPIWEFGASPDTVRSIVQMAELTEEHPDHALLAARGVSGIFRARRIRFPPTGSSYKLNFSPARAV